MLLTASVFLPYPLTCMAILVGAIYVLAGKERRRSLITTRYAAIVPVLCAILLIVPLCYGNYPGFFAGVCVALLFISALYLKGFMAVPLVERLCALCCAMSFLDAAVALCERLIPFKVLWPFYHAVLGVHDTLNNPQVRVVGLTYNANIYAALLEFVILMAFYRLLAGGRRPFYLATIAVNAVALFATDCRSAWAPILAGLLVIFLLRGQKIAVLVLAGLTGLFFAAVKLLPWLLPRFFHFGKAASERMVIWKISFKDFLAHPVFGHGMLANLQITKNWYVPHAHNLLLDVMQSTGVVGTLLTIAYISILLVELGRAFRAGGARQKNACGMCFACCAAVAVHGITDIPVMGIMSGLFFFLIMAMRPGRQLWPCHTEDAGHISAKAVKESDGRA